MGVQKAYNREASTTDDLSGTPSAKQHPKKVQDSVINKSYFVGQGWGCKRPITVKRVPLTI